MNPSTVEPVSLDPMRWWDIERILPLERELFGDSAWTAEMFWAELAHPQTRWYLVAGGHDSLGYGGVMVNGSDADVQTLAVARAARGKGVGTALLRALLDRAGEQGATRVTLEVRADNDPAIALYARHGFERIAIRRGYYQPGGADAWIMQR